MTMIEDKSFSSNELFFDEGCEYANSCLNCSLPLCKYDDPILDNSKSKINRNSLIFSIGVTIFLPKAASASMRAFSAVKVWLGFAKIADL